MGSSTSCVREQTGPAFLPFSVRGYFALRLPVCVSVYVYAIPISYKHDRPFIPFPIATLKRQTTFLILWQHQVYSLCGKIKWSRNQETTNTDEKVPAHFLRLHERETPLFLLKNLQRVYSLMHIPSFAAMCAL
jgi:hypothetical protein